MLPVRCFGATRRLCTQISEASTSLPIFRTNENNPAQHSEQHIGMFYTIPQSDCTQLFSLKGICKKYESQFETFREASLMVREPAVDIINCIRQSDLTAPVVRYVVYGPYGTGKTAALMHVSHFGLKEKWILFRIPWFHHQFMFVEKRQKEWQHSSFKTGRVDLPVDTAMWLNQFKIMNASLIQELDLRTTKTYTWTVREQTEEGSSLMDVVNVGINRVRFASDVMGILAKELKIHSTNKRCKTLCVMDGVNSLFQPVTPMRRENREPITPEELTVVQACLKMLRTDWSGGAVVLSVDSKARLDHKMYDKTNKHENYLPRHLLHKKGWDALFPFVPVAATNYSRKEMDSCIDYYIDRRWIHRTSSQSVNEMEFLSGRNPGELSRVAAQW